MDIQTHPWQAEVREAIYNIEIVPYQDQLIGSYRKFGLKPRRFTTAFLDL